MKIESEHYLHIVPSMRSNPRLSADIHEQLSRQVDFSEGIDDVRQLPLVIIFRPQGRPDDEFSEIVEPLAQTRQDRKRDKLLITALSSSRQGQKFNPKVSSLRFKAIWTIYVSSGSLDIKSSLSTIYNLASVFVTEYGFKKKSSTQELDQRTGFQTSNYTQRKRERNSTDIPHISPKAQRLLPSTATTALSTIVPISLTSGARRFSGFAEEEEPDTFRSDILEISQREDNSLLQVEIPQARKEDPQNTASNHEGNKEDVDVITVQPSRVHGLVSHRPVGHQTKELQRSHALHSSEIPQSVRDDPRCIPSIADQQHVLQGVITEQPRSGHSYVPYRYIDQSTEDTLQKQPMPSTERSQTEESEPGRFTGNKRLADTSGSYTVSSMTGRGVTSQVDCRSSQYTLPNSSYRQSSPNRTLQFTQQTSLIGDVSFLNKSECDVISTDEELKPSRTSMVDTKSLISGGTLQRPTQTHHSSDWYPAPDVLPVVSTQSQGGVLTRSREPEPLSNRANVLHRHQTGTVSKQGQPSKLQPVVSQKDVPVTKTTIKDQETLQAVLDDMDQGHEALQIAIEKKCKIRAGLLPRILSTTLEEVNIPSKVSRTTALTDLLQPDIRKKIEKKFSISNLKDIIKATLKLQAYKVENEVNRAILRDALTEMENGDDALKIHVESKYDLRSELLQQILKTTLKELENISTYSDTTDLLPNKIRKKIEDQYKLRRGNLKNILEDTLKQYMELQRNKAKHEHDPEILQDALNQMEDGNDKVQVEVEGKYNLRPGRLPRILSCIIEGLQKYPTTAEHSESQDLQTSSVRKKIQEQIKAYRRSATDVIEEYLEEYLKREAFKAELEQKTKELKEILQKALDQMELGDEHMQINVEAKFKIRPGNLPRILRATLEELDKRLTDSEYSEITTMTTQSTIEEQFKLRKGSLDDIINTVANPSKKRSRSNDKKSNGKKSGDKKFCVIQ